MKFFIVILVMSLQVNAKTCEYVKAAIDVGSGTTKLKVAKVDTCLSQIKSILFEKNIPVGFKEDLKNSSKNELSSKIYNESLKALIALKAEAKKFGAKDVYAVATSAFRTSSNGDLFAKNLSRDSGIQLKVISQVEEAKIGFIGAISKSGSNAKQSVVWDIGGGSMQITTYNKDQSFDIYEGKIAAVSFKNHITKNIMKNNKLTTPNPISKNTREDALKYIQKIASKTVNKSIKEKIKHSIVLGIGGVHYYSLLKKITSNNYYTVSDIDKRLKETLGKTDKQLGGEYAKTDISNLILVKGYMLALGIKKVQAYKVNLTDGVLLNPGVIF